ncbi:PAM68 family protein [Spirulina subsalsa FACHB-351]|uniref:PAM68 family protein n=1 Tax=Spirulina subsalsa FACHB-351 TaxID=234711 RepID=A0ABT3L9P4_9CYAN|nr:PAM68 family protein [Spirulina subsalsa]MCW6038228.1 PAM68 family protein [Spirulina subsalsa FACHB-351]
MPAESERNPLPFEPRSKRKKPKKNPAASSNPAPSEPALKNSSPPQTRNSREEADLSAIPEVVSRRMIRRMALFSGSPTVLALSSLFIFYWIKTQTDLEVPNPLILLVSFGLFGLGVLGLSYGIFSASWDEEQAGTLIGFREFRVNLGRTIRAWRNSRQALKKTESD